MKKDVILLWLSGAIGGVALTIFVQARKQQGNSKSTGMKAVAGLGLASIGLFLIAK